MFGTPEAAAKVYNGESVLLVDADETNVVLLSEMPDLTEFHPFRIERGSAKIAQNLKSIQKWARDNIDLNNVTLSRPVSDKKWLWIEGV